MYATSQEESALLIDVQIGAVELSPLNVIIGRNGSGKTNFLEAIDLLRNAPSSMTTTIREGDGVADWLFKGARKMPATLEFVFENRATTSMRRFPTISYRIAFAEVGQRFTIVDERITGIGPQPRHAEPCIFYDYCAGQPVIYVKSGKDVDEYYERRLSRDEISPEQSILKQRRDPDSYPEITSLANELVRTKIYREWALGRSTPIRRPANVDAANDFLGKIVRTSR